MLSSTALARLYLLVGVGLLIRSAYLVIRALNSRHWKVVAGTVVGSKTESSRWDDYWHSAVRYRFFAVGRERESDRLAFGNVEWSKSSAERIVQQYPAGSAVRVYYDPSNPDSAVLRPGLASTWKAAVVPLVTSAFLVVLGVTATPSRQTADLSPQVNLPPSPLQQHYEKGLLLLNNGKEKEAELEFRAAVKIYPHAPSYDWLGWIALQRQDWTEAAECGSRIIEIDPHYEKGRGYGLRATALHFAGKDLEAARDAATACQLGNDDGCRMKELLPKIDSQ